MRIHSWGQSGGVGGAQAVSGACAQPPSNAANQTSSDVSSQVEISKPTELVQKLAALKISDPTAFKAATNKVAEHFNNLASGAQGPERIGLAQLARTFANAAETGDLSALQPSQPTTPAVCDDEEVAPVESAPAAPTISSADRALTTAFSSIDSFAGTEENADSDSMQKLSALKTSNPAAFKQVMNRVAEQLSGFANFATGEDASSLSELAGRFASAAETGDISGFKLESAAAAPASVPPPAAPPPPPVEDPRTTALDLVDALTAPSASGLTQDPLAKLKELKGADPGTFRNVMNQVAERLDQLVNFAEGDTREGLAKLAGVFASGSESGDLSALEPPASQQAQTSPGAEPPSNHWRSGHAMASYHRHGPAPLPPQAIEDAYSSALSLIE
jgi:hypothetical protein